MKKHLIKTMINRNIQSKNFSNNPILQINILNFPLKIRKKHKYKKNNRKKRKKVINKKAKKNPSLLK